MSRMCCEAGPFRPTDRPSVVREAPLASTDLEANTPRGRPPKKEAPQDRAHQRGHVGSNPAAPMRQKSTWPLDILLDFVSSSRSLPFRYFWPIFWPIFASKNGQNSAEECSYGENKTRFHTISWGLHIFCSSFAPSSMRANISSLIVAGRLVKTFFSIF